MVVNIGLPSGDTPNQGWKLYLTSLIMVLSAGVFVTARIASRWRVGKLASDDYTITAALIFSIALSVTIQLAVVHGYGKHQSDLSKEDLHTCLKFFWIAQIPYKIVVCLNKVSIVLLYMRIFIARHFRWQCFAVLAIVISSGIATVVATILQCVPFERSWNKTVRGKCIDSNKFWLANAVLNISTDVLVLALPVREVFRLQLKLKERIMLCAVFMLGGFVTVTSLLRVSAVANSAHNMQDQTWNFIPRGIWTLIEANLGMICSCLVVLRQMIRKVFGHWFGTSRSGPKSRYAWDQGGSSAADRSIRSGIKELPLFSNRQRVRLDNTMDDDEEQAVVWKRNELHPMASLASRRTQEGRTSDETHDMPSTSTIEDEKPSHPGSVDSLPAWPSRQAFGIMKKVDVQVDSQPSGSLMR